MDEQLIILEYEDFIDQFKPIKNTIDKYAGFDGCMFETYSPEYDFVKEQPTNTIWTLIDGDMETLEIVPGKHFVNRLGYFITEVPWTHEYTIVKV